MCGARPFSKIDFFKLDFSTLRLYIHHTTDTVHEFICEYLRRDIRDL